MAELVTTPTWLSDEDFMFDGVRFHAGGLGSIRPSTPDEFFIMKPHEMLVPYLELIDRESPRTIIELGVYFGGSTALLALRPGLSRLTAIERSERPVDALTHLLRSRGLQDRVRVHYGVDQGDETRLTQIADEDFGQDARIDCVIDDASHKLDLTRTSFERLFPRLRVGGVYIIEDWGWGHFPFAQERPGPSMARLIVEIMLSMPYRQGLVDEMMVNRYYAVVRRGALDTNTVKLEDCISKRGHRLLAGTDG